MRFFDWCLSSSGSPSVLLREPMLRSGKVIDAWHFKSCQEFHSDDELVVEAEGRNEFENMMFGAFELPYVSTRLAALLSSIVGAQVQWVPVRVKNSDQKLYLLNALREIRCIDEDRSYFEKWQPGNTARPDKAGQYKWFADLMVDESRIPEVDIFRPWGWHMALIVSSRVMHAAETVGVPGTTFVAVN